MSSVLGGGGGFLEATRLSFLMGDILEEGRSGSWSADKPEWFGAPVLGFLSNA